MTTRLIEGIDGARLAAALGELSGRPEVSSILLLGCSHDAWSVPDLEAGLAAAEVPVFGGLFPGLVADGAARSSGTLLLGLPVAAQVATVPLDGEPAAQLAAVTGRLHPRDGDSAVIVADAAGDGVVRGLEIVFDAFGTTCSYLGGGSGRRDLRPAPSVVAEGRLHAGVAAVAVLGTTSHVGVAHGWTPVGRHLPVTAADGRRIAQLDGRPAVEAYRDALRQAVGPEVATRPIEELGRWHPLGIARLDAEPVVRELVAEHDDGSLSCIADVAQGCYVRLLRGDEASLLAGARLVAAGARAALEAGGDHGQALLLDCVSRVAGLGERFDRELAALDLGRPLHGALTIGEIASARDRVLDLYNKAVVVGVIGGGWRDA